MSEKYPELPHGPANADGQAHFTYYRPDLDWSFVWSGHFEDPIQVCPNGYGEPCQWLLRTEESTWRNLWSIEGEPEVGPAWFLKAFHWMCDQFVEAKQMADSEDTFAEIVANETGVPAEKNRPVRLYKDLGTDAPTMWRPINE